MDFAKGQLGGYIYNMLNEWLTESKAQKKITLWVKWEGNDMKSYLALVLAQTCKRKM